MIDCDTIVSEFKSKFSKDDIVSCVSERLGLGGDVFMDALKPWGVVGQTICGMVGREFGVVLSDGELFEVVDRLMAVYGFDKDYLPALYVIGDALKLLYRLHRLNCAYKFSSGRDLPMDRLMERAARMGSMDEVTEDELIELMDFQSGNRV